MGMQSMKYNDAGLCYSGKRSTRGKTSQQNPGSRPTWVSRKAQVKRPKTPAFQLDGFPEHSGSIRHTPLSRILPNRSRTAGDPALRRVDFGLDATER